MRDDILACGNAIDTYYKERRIGMFHSLIPRFGTEAIVVKYFKAQSWKERLLDIAQRFDTHRKDIQSALSMRIAVGVDDMASKLDAIMTSHFEHRSSWEKRIESQIDKYGSRAECIGDDIKLQRLVALSEDFAIGSRPKMIPDGIELVKSVDIVRREIYASLDTLCQKNADIFERKLGLQTKQLEETVVASAKYVIDQLSGPYDRLQNEVRHPSLPSVSEN
jgi:hypothetical protein